MRSRATIVNNIIIGITNITVTDKTTGAGH
jgi:hypothetical protein